MRIVDATFRVAVSLSAALACGAWRPVEAVGADEAVLPAGVAAVWDAEKAFRETTATRERISINGLWRWQPAEDAAEAVPAGGWGFFKVPGSWPGITDYMQKDSQTVHAHPDWQRVRLAEVTAAWYEREITVPAEWAGRRITVGTELVNSFAVVFLDGRRVGEIRFPAGEVDLTAACRPGETHLLSMHVAAMPLAGVMLSYTDTNAAREVPGRVRRRGLCGDVFLASSSPGPRLGDARIVTSVRKGEITIQTPLEGLTSGTRYTVRARITDGDRTVEEFTGEPFTTEDLDEGRFVLTRRWLPERLWDLHTPENMYEARVALLDGGGAVLDAGYPQRFGFRELWIDGRDFYLNGSRVFLSSVPLDNAQVGAALATYEAARESLERLQSFGINFVYTHNYDCQPGAHLGFAEILRAADDVGMLVALSQPHFTHYEWDAPDAEETNGYAAHAAYYAAVAGNHPSVVFYSTSHNATGYAEDMNPDKIDGLYDARESWSLRNAQRALRAEAIIRQIDPSRIVYHHSSGNLGSMHTSNFYANWVPVQEMSDWFEHWATAGVKPLFTCEYAVPFTWDWAMYRGWYEGERSFGSARVPWEYCLAEWNAQFHGAEAYRITDEEKANLRWEARQFRAGRLWHRWDYPHNLNSRDFESRYRVIAAYLDDNWRAFRTWGISANSPWQFANYWRPRDDVDRSRRELPVDWEGLQRPGFSPDYIEDRYETLELAFERDDWIPTLAAEALYRNNMPLLAYIAGKPAAFTSKDHNFHAGETVEKQVIVINNSREPATATCRWSLELPTEVAGTHALTLPTGEQERVPLRFPLPSDLAPGEYTLRATVEFGSGEVQDDAFAIHVLPQAPPPRPAGRTALFDPVGETAALLENLEVPFEAVDAGADLAAFDQLIVGKEALSLDSPAPDITPVRGGLKVVVFEQSGEVLEQRFGFRVAEYGLRHVFRRVPDHPLLSGIAEEHLRDWRGEATLLPPRLTYTTRPSYGPTVQWCGIPVTRAWRCGNRGNVASALIEKPACGDFLPILDGGYALQYAALLEYREGDGMVLFCQMDVTGRTETDPAAHILAGNILRYVADWQPASRRRVLYVGEPEGRRHLEAAGIALVPYEGGRPPADGVLIVGPGGGQQLAGSAAEIADWLESGGAVLAVALDEEEANGFLPFDVRMEPGEHIAAYFEPFAADSLLAGVSPAEVHNRDPRELPLAVSGGEPVGGGVLATAGDANVVFCQLAPWHFDQTATMNLKRTFRRVACLKTRLLANLGAAGSTPLLAHFHQPVDPAGEQRWLRGLYLDVPEEWDDPYRFFRW